MTNDDPFVEVNLYTMCGGRPDNDNLTTIEFKNFAQPIKAENIRDVNGYGIRITIVGDWEAHYFMRGMKEARKLFNDFEILNRRDYELLEKQGE